MPAAGTNESGRFIGYGLAPESTRGTSAAPVVWFPQDSADFQNKDKFIRQTASFGVLNINTASDIAESWSEGKISGQVYDQSSGHFYKAIMGSSSSAATGDSSGLVYQTTYTQSQSNTPQSYTIARKDLLSCRRYALGMEKELSISFMVGEYVKFDSDWMALPGVTSSDTVAYTLENRFKASYANAKVANVSSGIAGASAIPMKSLKLTVTRTIAHEPIFGQTNPDDFVVSEFSVKGEFVLRYLTQAYENLSFSNTLQALNIALVNTDVTIGASSNPSQNFLLPKVTLDTWQVDQSQANVTEQTVGFSGNYDFASTSEIQISTTSLKSSY